MTNLTREQILAAIEPKSDQWNYDDLISGPQTVTVAGVSAGSTEQPINIRIEGEKRYFRPCKTMRRVLVLLWGDDGHKWVGRSMTLYGDPNVKFGGVAVGGIRISHMSDIDGPQTINLTATRGKRAPVKIQPIPRVETTRVPDELAGNDKGSEADSAAANPPTRTLKMADAKAAAAKGTPAFMEFYGSLNDEQLQKIAPHVDKLKDIAAQADLGGDDGRKDAGGVPLFNTSAG